MTTYSSVIEVSTSGENSVVNLTESVNNKIRESGIREGLAHIFVQSTTSSIFICEDEKGLISDIIGAARRIAPDEIEYRHNLAWHDDNGKSHVKSTFLGQGVSVPVRNSILDLGTWQEIFLSEFDIRPRTRKIVISVIS